jgi:uncharacterized protein YggL (DUF469 family)
MAESHSDLISLFISEVTKDNRVFFQGSLSFCFYIFEPKIYRIGNGNVTHRHRRYVRGILKLQYF